MNSVLLIDKPTGMTSYRTIEEVKRLLKIKKIGHSGTLDKSASGLLIVCTGWATKLTRYFFDSDKRYIGEVKLGIVTDTFDSEGRILERRSCDDLNYDRILQIKKKFIGEIFQLPPPFSAIKIDGQRASDLVREGRDVQLKKKAVFIKKLDILKVDIPNSLITIDVICSMGTYIRSLARDIGEFLKTGAYLYSLRRMISGLFSVDNAVTLRELKEYIAGKCHKKVFCYKPVEALSNFGIVIIKDSRCEKVLNGAFFKKDDLIDIKVIENKPFLILDEKKDLIAIAEIDICNWLIKYLNVFNCK